MKVHIRLLLLVSCMVLQQFAFGAPSEGSRELIGKWVEKGKTNASLSITATNLTVLAGTNQEVWVFVPSTNRFGIFACRNGVTNELRWAYGGSSDRVIYLGNRRWNVNPEQAATEPQ
jgi:hypothetical protein